MIVALLGTPTRTNLQLVGHWRRFGLDARVMWPSEAEAMLGPGDIAILRLDVLPTLDGVEPGLDAAEDLEARGVRLFNRPAALLATHDKLVTARLLAAAAVPQPRTTHVEPGGQAPEGPFPCVVKPRFGSWGQDVFACRSADELAATLDAVRDRPWFSQHGALVQALLDPVRRDLRIVVAGDQAVAGAERTAAPDEWRTNVSLGGSVVATVLPPAAVRLAVRAAQAIGIDFAGVDLLPTGDGWVVLELNGAVDFDERYALRGLNPYSAILDALGIAHAATPEPDGTEVAMARTVRGKPAQPGDEIVIAGHSVGNAPRSAVILEVLGEPGHERFRVRWEDGHESIFFPGEDALVHSPAKQSAKTRT